MPQVKFQVVSPVRLVQVKWVQFKLLGRTNGGDSVQGHFPSTPGINYIRNTIGKKVRLNEIVCHLL